MDGENANLQSLFDFYGRQRQDRPLTFSHAKKALNPSQLYSLQALRNHLNNPLLDANWIQIVEKGQTLDLTPFSYAKSVQSKSLSFLDKNALNEILARGAALVLEGLDILDPKLGAISAKLEQDLPCALSNCVAFLSQKGNEAYYAHCDTDDVLVIQIEGRKIWNLYEPQQRRYLGTAPLNTEKLGTPIAELSLEPGDLLYVRAGVPHRCLTPDRVSLHISYDLLDKTPSVEHITREASHRYNHSCAEPYSDIKDVVARYADLLQSKNFLRDLSHATEQTKKNTVEFRRHIANASGLGPLENLGKPQS